MNCIAFNKHISGRLLLLIMHDSYASTDLLMCGWQTRDWAFASLQIVWQNFTWMETIKCFAYCGAANETAGQKYQEMSPFDLFQFCNCVGQIQSGPSCPKRLFCACACTRACGAKFALHNRFVCDRLPIMWMGWSILFTAEIIVRVVGYRKRFLAPTLSHEGEWEMARGRGIT